MKGAATMSEHIDTTTIHARRTRVLGPDARCRQCGEAALAALQRDTEGIICYECDRARRGKRTVENHHPLGKANDMNTTIGVPGNFHRQLSAMQADWPEAVRNNPTRDPLLWVVAVALAVRDFASVLTVYAQQIADWLVQFHAALVAHHGAAWVSVLALPSLWGAM